MFRFLCILVCIVCSIAATLSAQSPSSVAVLDVENSHVQQTWRGQTEIRLQLSQGVPFRVFTLNDPARLVLDFRDLDWSGVTSEALLRRKSGISALRFGGLQPGWSRMVADLARPMLPDQIGMAIDEAGQYATLTLSLTPATIGEFAAASGLPDDVLWPNESTEIPIAPVADDRFVIVIDPGHGGIDPGARRGDLFEKELMLDVARELRDTLVQEADIEVLLTRDSDTFVSLAARKAFAHRAGADIFISLHADALREGDAQGATIYLLSDKASDAATADLAERHNRADILAGVDLSESDDEITGVLLDLARQETEPRSEALARALVVSMTQAGGPMNSRPLRKAGFSVLKSADIPSVLLEVGFLSSARDLDNLINPEWRGRIVAAMARAILDWKAQDDELQERVRR